MSDSPPETLPQEALCAFCQTLDLEVLSAPLHPGEEENPQSKPWKLDLEKNSSELRSSSCPLCCLFGRAAPNETEYYFSSNVQSKKARLRRFPQSIVEREGACFSYVTVVTDSGPQLSLPSAFFSLNSHRTPIDEWGIRPIQCDSLDIGFVKRCLDRCQTDHTLKCAPSSAPAACLNLIDCRSRVVVPNSGSYQYAALSYVWSQCEPDNPSEAVNDVRQSGVLVTLPRLVEDAITLALKLGINFLWCDRYCINQNDEKELATQVHQMDKIYANAQLVIVAVADVNGLPGIGGTTRERQYVSNIGDHSIVLPLENPSSAIENSKWNSRGWTFQEAVLARRCLFMCEDQAVFECNSASFEESIPQALAVSADHRLLRERRWLDSSRPIPNLDSECGTEENLFNLISRFSERHLSYPSDSLRAMEGVFNAYRVMEKPIHSYCGIPVRFPEDQTSTITVQDNLLKGILWYHKYTGARNALFPSWSWAGWSGGKIGFLRDLADPRRTHKFSCEVWHETADGEIAPFNCEEVIRAETTRVQNPAANIHLEAKWLPIISIQKDMEMNRNCRRVVFKTGKPSVFLRASVHFDEEKEYSECEDIIGIVVDSIRWKWNWFFLPILVLGKKGSHYERIGIAWEQNTSQETEFIDETGNIIETGFYNGDSWSDIAEKENELWEDALQNAPSGRFPLR